KKEPLSFFAVKLLLIILIFTTLVAIIISNVYIVQIQYKNVANNKITKAINQKTENYYDALEKKCAGESCCLSSFQYMKENNYKEVDKNGKCSDGLSRNTKYCATSFNEKCPDGFNENMNRCIILLSWCEPIKKLNLIGNYINGIMSMCAQNCNRYYIGSYEIVNELQNIDGNNKKEIILAKGDMIKIMELPTIAGPGSREQSYPEKVESVKFKISNYEKIDFTKISVSEKELSNYLENKDAEFNLKFENPLDEELKFKFRIDDFEIHNNFQDVVLKPNEIKNVKYIYKKDNNLKNNRKEDDTLDLVIINDFADEENYRKYYWDEANNISSDGTMICIDKFIELENCKKNDTLDWQTYRNKEFEFEYPSEKLKINNQDSSKDLWSLLFLPVDENESFEHSLNLGSLIYCNNNTSKHLHLTQHKNFQEYKESIISTGNLKDYNLFESNNLEWFCYIPLATKNIEYDTKTCITEKSKNLFYQISFSFKRTGDKYFNTDEFDKLIRSFKSILCEKIMYKDSKDRCYYDYAMSRNNKNLCEKITDNVLKNECYDNLKKKDEKDIPVLWALGSEPDAISIAKTADVFFTTMQTGLENKADKIVIEELNKLGEVIKIIGNLNDNGVNGDLSANDYIYSGTFKISSSKEGNLFFRAKANFLNISESIYTDKYKLGITRFPIGSYSSDMSKIITDPKTGEKMISNEIIVGFINDVSPSSIENIVKSINGEIVGTIFGLGVYQVKISDTDNIVDINKVIDKLLSCSKVEYAEPNYITDID
ncbi:hypothetical protein KAI92_03375, partial [Candidatus Parcubacteria bacterium]|nr:hypothetical protein [Candidatus Parcubacteria bacterium]